MPAMNCSKCRTTFFVSDIVYAKDPAAIACHCCKGPVHVLGHDAPVAKPTKETFVAKSAPPRTPTPVAAKRNPSPRTPTISRQKSDSTDNTLLGLIGLGCTIAAVATILFFPVSDLQESSPSLGGHTNISTGDRSSSSAFSSEEQAYQQSRAESRQRSYNVLRDNDIAPDQAGRMADVIQEMDDRDKRIRNGTYRRP